MEQDKRNRTKWNKIKAIHETFGDKLTLLLLAIILKKGYFNPGTVFHQE